MKDLVVTGGSGGLGRAIVQAFQNLDWAVHAPGRVEMDVRDPRAVKAYFQSKQLDLLVCSAGIVRDGLLAHHSEATWDEVIGVNFQGAVDCAAAVLPGMIRRGKGHIVFISSYSAIHPPSGQAAYATAKAALLGLSASIASQYGCKGVRSNVILPGFMDTTMTVNVSAARRSEVLGTHALGELNTPDATARFIRFLHEDLSFTSGQVFQLDSRLS